VTRKLILFKIFLNTNRTWHATQIDIRTWVFSQAADFIHGKQCTYNVILLYAWVTIVAMETQRFSFLLLYICHCQ